MKQNEKKLPHPSPFAKRYVLPLRYVVVYNFAIFWKNDQLEKELWQITNHQKKELDKKKPVA
jgi:hypothetical protein